MKNHTTETARFWIFWNGSDVRLALKDGQTVTFSKGGPTEEGWQREYRSYSREGEIITREILRDGVDCDGRMTTDETDETTLAEIRRTPPFAGNMPYWTAVGSSQRDYTAESMGY